MGRRIVKIFNNWSCTGRDQAGRCQALEDGCSGRRVLGLVKQWGLRNSSHLPNGMSVFQYFNNSTKLSKSLGAVLYSELLNVCVWGEQLILPGREKGWKIASQRRWLLSWARKKFVQGRENSPCKGMPDVFNDRSGLRVIRSVRDESHELAQVEKGPAEEFEKQMLGSREWFSWFQEVKNVVVQGWGLWVYMQGSYLTGRKLTLRLHSYVSHVFYKDTSFTDWSD